MLLFGVSNEDNVGSFPLPSMDGIERVFICYPDNKVVETNTYVEYKLGSDKVAIYRIGANVSAPIIYVIDIDPSQYRFNEIVKYLERMINDHIILVSNSGKCFMTNAVEKHVRDMLYENPYEAVIYYRSKRQDNIRKKIMRCMKEHYDLEYYTKGDRMITAEE